MAKKETKKVGRYKTPKSAEIRVVEFVEAYLLNFNASTAYLTAFERCSPSSAAACASAYLNDVNVQQYLQRRLKERREQLHLDQSYVVRKLTDIVETDYTQAISVMTEEQLQAMPEHVRKLVQGVKLKKKTWLSGENNDEEITEEYEVTFMSKDKALEALGKHTGAFARDNMKGVVDLGKMSYTDMILAMSELPDGE